MHMFCIDSSVADSSQRRTLDKRARSVGSCPGEGGTWVALEHSKAVALGRALLLGPQLGTSGGCPGPREPHTCKTIQHRRVTAGPGVLLPPPSWGGLLAPPLCLHLPASGATADVGTCGRSWHGNWQPSLERVTWSRNAAAMFFSLSRGVCPSLLLSGAPHVLVFCHYPHSPVPSNPVSYKGKTNGVFFTKHKKLPNLFFYGGRRTGRRICIAPALVTEDYHY